LDLVLRELLEEAFGYAVASPLTLPCDADALEQIKEEEDVSEAVA
jgi:hypothetical protein